MEAKTVHRYKMKLVTTDCHKQRGLFQFIYSLFLFSYYLFTALDTINHLTPALGSTYPLESLELYRWPQRRYILKVNRITSLTPERTLEMLRIVWKAKQISYITKNSYAMSDFKNGEPAEHVPLFDKAQNIGLEKQQSLRILRRWAYLAWPWLHWSNARFTYSVQCWTWWLHMPSVAVWEKMQTRKPEEPALQTDWHCEPVNTTVSGQDIHWEYVCCGSYFDHWLIYRLLFGFLFLISKAERDVWQPVYIH